MTTTALSPSSEVDRARAQRGYAYRAPDRTLDVEPHRIAYWREGRGPDLVFVHGWPLRAATFRHMVARLSDSFTCHLLDLPGTGRTVTPPGAKVSFVGHADVVRRAIDALGLSAYGLVAHDSGGFVARLVAASDPRAKALVLSNTEIPHHHPWQLGLYVGLLRAPFGASALRAVLRSRRLRRSSLAFGPCFTDPEYIEGEFFELFVRPLLDSADAANGQLRAMKSLSLGDLDGLDRVHARITAPVRLIWGARDTFFPLAKARSMLPEFAGPADLVEVPDGALFVHEDRADEVAAHARAFLTGLLH
ncbi:MAG: alpha/beta hydrolase [Polyangiaceae bacterium]